jgi:hypothetical protein
MLVSCSSNGKVWFIWHKKKMGGVEVRGHLNDPEAVSFEKLAEKMKEVAIRSGMMVV